MYRDDVNLLIDTPDTSTFISGGLGIFQGIQLIGEPGWKVNSTEQPQ
jgi:hypothetical protein